MNDPKIMIIALSVFGGSIVLAYILSFFVGLSIRLRIGKKKQAIRLIQTTIKFAVVIMGLVASLAILRIDIMPVLASLGLLGFGMGLALKDAISNLVAGISIMLYSPYEIGDIVEITGCKGKVVEINLRYTCISEEDKTHMIPNSICLSKQVVKFKKEQSVNKEES